MVAAVPPVVFAENLSIGYGKNIILKDFNASIQAGEFIAILGPNGAGKTTLLKTLLGSIRPIQGNLNVLDHPPHQDCVGIGYMPQQLLRPELQHLSARTLLTAAVQAHQWGLPHLTNHQQEEIEIALTQVEGLAFADQAFADCSGGQQRRIMLAQALLGQPKVLLLDEPLANLDFRHQENFIEILTKLSRKHRVTIIMTSHDISPLTNAISRVLYVVRGQAILGQVDQVLTSEKLTELYQTPMEVIHYKQRYFVVQCETGLMGGNHHESP